MNGIDACEEAQAHDAALDDEQAVKVPTCIERTMGRECTRPATCGSYCRYHYDQISNTAGT